MLGDIPSGCIGWCSIGYSLRFPAWPFNAGDWITVVCGVVAILAGLGTEVAREYNFRHRKALTKPISRPFGFNDTAWSHEEARLKANRRASEERITLTDRLPASLAMITVVAGVIASVPWLIFILGVLLVILLWRFVRTIAAAKLISDRLYLTQLARECRELNIHTPYIMAHEADSDVDEAFTLPADRIGPLINEFIIAKIKLARKSDDYAARKSGR